MSKAFQIYFETKDIIETNVPEDNLEIFSQILSALHEDLQSGTLPQLYSYIERDLETFEEVEVTLNIQELLEEILDLFSNNTTSHRFSDIIDETINIVDSTDSLYSIQLLAVLNQYTKNPDTELLFEMDGYETTPTVHNSTLLQTYQRSTQEQTLSSNEIYDRIRAISLETHRKTESQSVSWKNSAEFIFSAMLTGKMPPYHDDSGDGGGGYIS